MEGVVKHWTGLCGDVMEAPDLKMFQKHVGGTWGQGLGVTLLVLLLVVGLDDPLLPLQPSDALAVISLLLHSCKFCPVHDRSDWTVLSDQVTAPWKYFAAFQLILQFGLEISSSLCILHLQLNVSLPVSALSCWVKAEKAITVPKFQSSFNGQWVGANFFCDSHKNQKIVAIEFFYFWICSSRSVLSTEWEMIVFPCNGVSLACLFIQIMLLLL